MIDPVPAFTVVPDAVAKPSQEVDVPFVKKRLVTVPLVKVPFVNAPFVAKRSVEVTEAPVATVNVRP